MHYARGLLARSPRDCNGLLIVLLSKSHSAARRAEHDGNETPPAPPGLQPSFVCGPKQKLGCTIEAVCVPLAQSSCRKLCGQVYLRSFFHSLPGNIKQADRLKSGSAGAKVFGVRVPLRSEGGDDAGA